MGIKKISIIGGGISGLAALHFLKKRFKDGINVTLYEANAFLGGNIRSIRENGFIFEAGPNGFLNNSPATQELIEDLGLTDELIVADPFAKRRYIQLNGQLHLLPTGFQSFLRTPIMTTKEKFQLIGGIFNKNISTDQSIYDYVATRFCSGIAQKLADPFMRGIFGGDIKKLHMGHAFPKMKKGIMTSFKKGMGQVFERFEERYGRFIIKGQNIGSMDKVQADHIISTIPAYQASGLTGNQILDEIRYCTVSVVGLGFELSSLKTRPDGLGYLIPSNQGKDILGVLIESNVYQGRAPQGTVMIRVMIAQDAPAQVLIDKALKEIDAIFGLAAKPNATWVQVWPKAIPQYEMNYPSILKKITLEKDALTITGNFIKGISFNDCIQNSKDIAASMSI